MPSPPKEIFKYQETPKQGILKENTFQYIIKKIEIEELQGIKVYYKDIPFPRKGFPTPEAVSAVNVIKRLFIESVKTFSMKQFIFSWFISCFTYTTDVTITNRKRRIAKRMWTIEKMLSSFNRIAYGVISQYIIKPHLMTPCPAELQGIIYSMLTRLGISKDVAKIFASTFGTLIEYDSAYRYRIEDIFSETTKEKLSTNPYKEFKRLMLIYSERELDPTVKAKVKRLTKLITIPLLIPKVKLSIQKALEHCEFERLQLDEIDKYWCFMRHDYNYCGLSKEERMKNKELPQGVNIVL